MTSTLDVTHPFARLPRMSRRQVALVDGVAGWLTPGLELTFGGLEPALGVAPAVSVGAPRPFRPTGPVAPRCSEGVVVEHVPSGLFGVLELDAPLAIVLAWLGLDRRVDPSMPAPRALDRVEQGVLLYLVARALWAEAGPSAPLRVVGCAAEGGLEGARELAVTVPLTVCVGESSGHGWIHLPPGVEAIAAGELALGGSDDERLGRLEGLLFGLHVLVGRTELVVADWAAARPGDAVLVDEPWARPAEGGGWQGEARLRLGWGRPRWGAMIDEAGQLNVERWIEGEGITMVDDGGERSTPGAAELLAELPMSLTVELGSLALTAQQALALRPGQTLLLGRRPGDPVELRAGAKLLARGDLVDVDGELGVRLSEICPDRGAS